MSPLFFGALLVCGAPPQPAHADAKPDAPRLVIQDGHTASVSVVSFSPDGKRVVTVAGNPNQPVAQDTAARVWDVESGKQLLTLRGHTSWLRSAAFSPDGKKILTGSDDGTARVWDATTGTELLSLGSPKEPAGGLLSFSPDGSRVLAESNDWAVRLWDAETGKVVAVLTGHRNGTTAAAFSADGTRVATAGRDDKVRVWDAATGKEQVQLSGHTKPVYGLTFSQSGKRVLTAAGDGTVRSWEVEPGKVSPVLPPAEVVNWALFSADRRRAVTLSDDKRVRVRDTETWKQLAVLKDDTKDLFPILISADGNRVVTNSPKGGARVWDADTGADRPDLKFQIGSRTALSADGTRAASVPFFSGSVQVCDVVANKELSVLKGHVASAAGALVSPDGTRVAVGVSGTEVRVFGPGNAVAVLKVPKSRKVGPIAFSPDGKRLATGSPLEDRTRVWDLETAKELVAVDRVSTSPHGTKLAPDGTKVLVVSDRWAAHVWDVGTGKALHTLNGHRSHVDAACFSPDGSRVLTASADETARLWDAATGKELHILKGHTDGVHSAYFSPDGKRVVTASRDGTARVWSAETGKELLGLKANVTLFYASFGPGGKTVLTTAYNNTVQLWDASTGAEVLKIKAGAADHPHPAVLAPGGKRVLTAAYRDRVVRVWDAETGKELLALKGHTGMILSATYSPDGTRVFTASTDGTARVWDAATGKELCALVVFNDGWAVVAPDGRYDASDPDMLAGLHFVVGTTPVPLGKFRDRFLTPNLLAKCLGSDTR